MSSASQPDPAAKRPPSTSSAPGAPATPIVLGRYRLDEQVGQGGMAVVWRGFDTQLRRTVAVKLLHAHLITREEIRRRFSREAHAVARLHHPHILDIYDFSGPEADPSYLVTEFIPGSSLRAFAEAHPFDPPELAACCAVSLAEALEHAHAANVVHRDLKPENVMVREDGLVKLTDFGIAALLDPDEKFTVTGAILGSPAHLAPETIEGKPADPRSDLFSLGTVLYWLACGQLPFQANSPAALLQKILEGRPVDPRSVRPAVSDGLAALIAKLLERDPDKRIQSATEAKRELVALLSDAGIDDPMAAFSAFVSGKPPEAAAQKLRERLIARSLQRGEEAVRSRRTAAALASYSRVLSLDPGNALATKKVAQIRYRSRTVKRVKAVSMLIGLLVALGLLGTWVVRVGMRHRAAAKIEAEAAAATAAIEAKSAAPQPPPAPNQPGTPAPINDATKAPAVLPAAPGTGQSDHPASPGDPATHPGEREHGAEDANHDAQRRLARLHETEADPRAARPPAEKVRATLNVHWVWAHVYIDGQDLGESQTFTRELSAGNHRVLVSHSCCLDNVQIIDIEPGQTRYTLEPGKPKPARLSITNAPAEAQVTIDGVTMGPSGSLDAHELPMTDQPTREVQLTVGDRSSKVTLQAGHTNPIDYLKMGQGSAP